MTTPDDRDLRDAFEALRRAEAARTPPFEATVAAARARPAIAGRRRLLALAAAVLAAVALALVLAPRRPGVRIDLATVRWQSPTDFLLQLPGDALLRTVPEVGVTPSIMDWRIP